MKNKLAECLKFISYLLEDVECYKKMPYGQYLNTYHWQQVRKAKLEEVGHSCQICNHEKTLQIHHRTYERLGNEKLIDLTVLCKECHQLFHSNSKLKKG